MTEDTNPPPKDVPPKPAETSADVAAGGKTPREVALEKRIATLEDGNKSLGDQVKSLLTVFEERDKEGRTPARSILDEANDFLGFGLS